MTEMADDSQRAQLPVSVQSGDTSPIGLSLDLSSHSKVLMPIPGDEIVESSTPVPALMVLNNEGFMASWWVIYSESIRQNTIYPGLIAATSIPSSSFDGGALMKQTTETTVFDKATPTSVLGANRSIPSFGSPTPLGSGSKFGTPSTLGSSAPRLGTVSAPRAFNTTPVFGQAAFDPSSKAQTLKPGFSAPVFGQPSTPSLGTHTSGWGNQANSGTNSAFENGTGTNKPVPIFGSQTNIGLNGFASLASGTTKSVFNTQSSTEPSTFYHESPNQAIGSTKTTSVPLQTPERFSLSTTFNTDHSARNDENKIENIRPNDISGNPFLKGLQTKPSPIIEDITINDGQVVTPKQNHNNDSSDTQRHIPQESSASESTIQAIDNAKSFDSNTANLNSEQSETRDNNTDDAEFVSQLPKSSKENVDSEYLSIEDSVKMLSGTSLGNEREIFKDQSDYFELIDNSEFKEDDEDEDEEDYEDEDEDEEYEKDEVERKGGEEEINKKDTGTIDSTENSDVLGEKKIYKNSSKDSIQIPKVNCVENVKENSLIESNDSAEAFKSENDIRFKDILDKVDPSSSGNGTATLSPSFVRNARSDTLKQQGPVRTTSDPGDLLQLFTPEETDKTLVKLAEAPKSNFLKQMDEENQLSATTLVARRDAENLQAELISQRQSDERRCREVAAKIKAEEKLHAELVARREAEERRRNEVIAQRKTEEKRRNELKAIWEAEEYQREQLRARKEAEEKQALVDSDDVSMQRYFASALEPTTRLNDFVAHSDYVSITTEENIPAQVETVYRDINSMIDTLGINSRSINEFIFGHTTLFKVGGRSEEDLRDDTNWILGEITTLSSIVDNNLSQELENGRIKNIDNKLEICREIQKDLIKLKVKHNEIKKIITTSRDPNYLAVARAQPLGLKQAAQQHDLRQGFMRFQRLLSEAEESLAILKAKIVSQTIINKKYSGSTGPTVETVMKTITKLTKMAEKRSGDVDVLEDLMRKIRLNTSPGIGRQETTKTPFRNNASQWNPRNSNICEYLTPERSRASPNQNFLSSSTGSSIWGSTSRRKLSGYTSEEIAQLRYKLDRKREMRNRLKLALQNTGVKLRVMDVNV